jgi:hypothetical protein
MDGKLLNTRQNDNMTFQMKVLLLYKNQGFLEEHKRDVLEENTKAAAARTKACLLKSTTSEDMQDSDINDDLEGWMDAFGYTMMRQSRNYLVASLLVRCYENRC